MSATTQQAPAAGDPFIRVSVDGQRFNVYYEDGRPYWVRMVRPDGVVASGYHVSLVNRHGDHAAAVRLAESFLDGLRDAVGAAGRAA